MVNAGWAPENGGRRQGGGEGADRCHRRVSRLCRRVGRWCVRVAKQCTPWIWMNLHGGRRRLRAHCGLWLRVVEDDLSGERGKGGIRRARGHGLLHPACGSKNQVRECEEDSLRGIL